MDISFPLSGVSSCVGSGIVVAASAMALVCSVGGLSVGSGIAQWHLLVVASVAVGVAAVALALAVVALVVAAAAVAVALAEVV